MSGDHIQRAVEFIIIKIIALCMPSSAQLVNLIKITGIIIASSFIYNNYMMKC